MATTPAKIKAFEAAEAVQNGADEIDMVINLGWVKDEQWGLVMNEIQTVKRAADGKPLKVIVETCLLTDAEKCRLCRMVTQGKVDYIKTSTGFSSGGATPGGCGTLCRKHRPRRKDQGCGRHQHLSGRRRFSSRPWAQTDWAPAGL